MQRRLLTASDDEIVRMWNFNSGALLRQFSAKGGPSLLTCLSFVNSSEDDAPGQVLFIFPLKFDHCTPSSIPNQSFKPVYKISKIILDDRDHHE